MLHQFRGERRAAGEQAEAAIELCTEHGFAYYLAWGKIIQGWSLAEQGEKEDGTAQMRQGLADLRAMGAGLREPYYLALLAEARGTAGQVEEGLSLLAEALEVVHESDERSYEAELHRFEGELLLMQGEAEDKVERSFHRAFEIARKQSSKFLELRAAMSLGRWRQRQDEEAIARKLLEEIYDRFTEGFDTIDLRKAKALLEKLA